MKLNVMWKCVRAIQEGGVPLGGGMEDTSGMCSVFIKSSLSESQGGGGGLGEQGWGRSISFICIFKTTKRRTLFYEEPDEHKIQSRMLVMYVFVHIYRECSQGNPYHRHMNVSIHTDSQGEKKHGP